jgi:uncharacterized protein YndB with AHSA1/START domain
MRFLKIFSVIVGISIVAFLALVGVFFPSYEYSHSIEVNAPQQKCWTAFHDTASVKNWLDGFESITLKSGQALQRDARYELVISDRGERMVMEEIVTDIVAPEHITYLLTNDVLTSEYTFTFTPRSDNITTVENHYCVTGNNILWKSILLLSKSYMSDASQQQLKKLKSVIEHQP